MKFQKLQTGPFSPSSSLPACSAPRRRCSAPSPPLFSAVAAVEGQPGHLLLALAAHASRPTSSTAFCLRAVPPLPCQAAPSARRPPPRRRRGPAKTEPQSPISCAQRHYKNPLDQFPSPFRSLPAQNPQNASAACPSSDKLDLTVEPPPPPFPALNRPHQSLRLTPAQLTGNFSSPRTHQKPSPPLNLRH